MNYLISLSLLPVGLLASGVVTVVWFFKFKVKGRYLYHLAAGINRFSPRLRLHKLEPFAWQKPGRAEQRVAEFQKAGFVALGVLPWPNCPMPGCSPCAIRKPEWWAW